MKYLMNGLVVLAAVFSANSWSAEAKTERYALLAYLKVQPGTAQKFLDAAKDVIAESRREPGNLVYNLHRSTKDPRQFVFYELFSTYEDMQLHRNSKHVKSFLKDVDPILVPGQFILDEYKYEEKFD